MFDHLVHIHQQFGQRAIGIELQQFKKVVTQAGINRYEVEAYNEYLLITNVFALPIGTRIISDTNSLEILTSQIGLEGLEEFSGLIVIELPANRQEQPIIEFIQIVKA